MIMDKQIVYYAPGPIPSGIVVVHANKTTQSFATTHSFKIVVSILCQRSSYKGMYANDHV